MGSIPTASTTPTSPGWRPYATRSPGLASGSARLTPKSRKIIVRLAALFGLDSLGGGLLSGALLAYWFFRRFGAAEESLAPLFFTVRLANAGSYLVAAWLSKRIGLLNTMVFTHIPANVLLVLVPLMPSLRLAIVVWLLRATISQMDVPTRQSYVLAVVDPDERSAAGGVTNVERSVGSAFAPALASPLLVSPAWHALPFLLAGTLKILYDLALWRAFRSLHPPEEGAG